MVALRLRYIAPLVVVAASLLQVAPAHSQTFIWVPTSGGLFNTAANWTPANGPPGAGDLVLFDLPNSQTVTFETEEIGGDSGCIRRSTREIAARATGQLKVDPPEGAYMLSASSGSIRPAPIDVGARRESAQNELLQP